MTKLEPKLAACLTKCRGFGTDPGFVGRLATSFGLGGIRHGTRVKPTPGAEAPGFGSDTQRVLGQNLRFCLELAACLANFAGAAGDSGFDRVPPVALAALPRRRPRGRRLRGLGRAAGEAFGPFGASQTPEAGWISSPRPKPSFGGLGLGSSVGAGSSSSPRPKPSFGGLGLGSSACLLMEDSSGVPLTAQRAVAGHWLSG